MTASAVFTSATAVEIRLSAHDGAVGVSLVDVEKPTRVKVHVSPCFEHVYHPLTRTLDVKCEHNKLGAVIAIEF
jgi:hypothetical protein